LIARKTEANQYKDNPDFPGVITKRLLLGMNVIKP